MSALRRNSARLAAITALACLMAGSGVAAAQPVTSDLWEGNRALAKVSSHLLRARALANEGRSAAQIAAAVPVLRLREGLPQVEVSLERLTPGLVDELRARGLEVDSFHLAYARVSGRVDPAALDRLAALPEVSTIYPRPHRGTRVGDATTQGDASMRADQVRPLGADGTGVTVGILSDSFNKSGLGGTVSGGVCACATPESACATVVNGMDNQDSGDLPAGIPILDDCTAASAAPDDPCFGLTDEGAAIGELIFDVAPQAGFMFHSAFNGAADFAGGITELVNCGADLIVDDVFYTREPFFQDGIIAKAAQAAFDAGVPYFSAAGNDGTFGIDDVYLDSDPADPVMDTPPVDGKDFHDFGGGDAYAGIILPAGCGVHVELQWSEPFDGILGDGAASDLNFYLLDSEADPASTFGANVVGSSITKQGCGIPAVSGGDPVEVIQYTNEEAGPKTVFLAVDHVCGDEGVEMRIVTIRLDCSPDFEDGEAGESTIFVDAQIFGHPAARDVMAVGAAFYGEIDTGGTHDDPPGQLDVEPYSSKGGNLPFYFDGAGDPLPAAAATAASSVVRDGSPPPEWRFKPDITSVDGTNTTFFNCLDPPGAPCVEGDGFPNFFGTSAAAPHATALAVLIWQLTGELISPRALHQLIEQAVLDMEIPGPDDLSGHGFADALEAARSVDDTLEPLIEILEFDLDGESFLTSVPVSQQPLQALDTLTVGNGNYDGVHGTASTLIFSDGFESGDVSSWGH